MLVCKKVAYRYLLITLHVQRDRDKVISIGIYIMFVDQKNNLNHTLVIDSPFQTFTARLLVEFID